MNNLLQAQLNTSSLSLRGTLLLFFCWTPVSIYENYNTPINYYGKMVGDGEGMKHKDHFYEVQNGFKQFINGTHMVFWLIQVEPCQFGEL